MTQCIYCRAARRLVGCPPFWHRKQMVMLRNIMEGKFTFGSPEWDDVTGEADIKSGNY